MIGSWWSLDGIQKQIADGSSSLVGSVVESGVLTQAVSMIGWHLDQRLFLLNKLNKDKNVCSY